MLLVLLIIIACIVLLLAVLILTDSLRLGVVPMPSLMAERMLVSDILKKYPDIKVVTDLGSGWGGMVRHLAQRLSEREIIGVEKSFIPHLFSRITEFPVRQKYGQGLINHHHGDIYSRTLENREAYITYLSGPVMKRLRKSFERDRPTGGVLISIAFAMPGWTPSRVEYAEGALRSAVYIYEL